MMGDESTAAETPTATSAPDPMAAVAQAAQAATDAFIRGDNGAGDEGAEAEEAGTEAAEAAEKTKDAAADDAEEKDDDGRPKLQRAKPNSAHERIRMRLQREKEARERMQSESSETAQLRSELEKARQAGELSQKQWQELEQLNKDGKHNEVAKRLGYDSFESWAKAYVEGGKDKPPPNPEVEALRKEMQELKEERERERREREEQRLRQEQEAERERLQTWVLEDVASHPVDEVRNINDAPDMIKNDFAAKALAIMEQDPDLPSDEVYGTILDGYRPLYEGLETVFRAQREAAGGSKPEAKARNANRGTAREANRRGSNAERQPSSTIDSEAAAGTRESPQLTPDNLSRWGDDQARAFLNRLNG